MGVRQVPSGPGRAVAIFPYLHRPILFLRGLLLAGMLLGSQGGCQSARPISSRRLIEHQAMIDFSGLRPAGVLESLKVQAAAPNTWEQIGPHSTSLYIHTQWRSPSTHTGVGAAFIRLPLPISAKTVLWVAKREYTKKADDGRVIAQWTDDLGRSWFEAENNKYHVRGYALAQGFEAWIVYFGYKTAEPPEPSEISLAARCVDTFLPLLGKLPATQPTTKPETTILR